MDSVIATRNDGFDANGSFLNGQTQWLPWPNKLPPSYIINDYFNQEYSIPNPYDNLGGYISLSQTSVKYHNSDGTIKWAVSNADVYNSNLSFIANKEKNIIHIINGQPHLVGAAHYSSTDRCFYSINLDDLRIVRGTLFAKSAFEPRQLGILNDDTLFFTGFLNDNWDNGIAKVIDPLTMNIGGTLNGCGYISRLRSSHSSSSATQAYFGVSLFNGCLTYMGSGAGVFSSGGYSLDVSAVLWGVNTNLDFTDSSLKTAVRTNHCFANNRFGNLTQVSKDLFVSDKPSNEHGYWTFNQPNTMYFSRQELEEWASNSFYAAHGIRIPLTQGV